MKPENKNELDALLENWSQAVDRKNAQSESLLNSLMQEFDNKKQFETILKIQRLNSQNRFYKILSLVAIFFLVIFIVLMIGSKSKSSEVNVIDDIKFTEDSGRVNIMKNNLDDIFKAKNFNFAIIDSNLELGLENTTIEPNYGYKFLISLNIIKRNIKSGKQEIRKCSFVMEQNTNFSFVKAEKFSVWVHEVDSSFLALDANYAINFESGKFELNDTFLLKYNEPQIIAKFEQQDDRITIIQMVKKI